jgi:hypothetical protein
VAEDSESSARQKASDLHNLSSVFDFALTNPGQFKSASHSRLKLLSLAARNELTEFHSPSVNGQHD